MIGHLGDKSSPFDWFWYLLDWIDDKMIKHRFYWFCVFVATHYPRGVK